MQQKFSAINDKPYWDGAPEPDVRRNVRLREGGKTIDHQAVTGKKLVVDQISGAVFPSSQSLQWWLDPQQQLNESG